MRSETMFGTLGLLAVLLVMVGVGYWRLQELASATQTLGTSDSEKMKLALEWSQTTQLNWSRTEAILRDTNPDAFHADIPDGIHPAEAASLSVTLPALEEALSPRKPSTATAARPTK